MSVVVVDTDSAPNARVPVGRPEAEDEPLAGCAGFDFAPFLEDESLRGRNLWNGASCGNPPHD